MFLKFCLKRYQDTVTTICEPIYISHNSYQCTIDRSGQFCFIRKVFLSHFVDKIKKFMDAILYERLIFRFLFQNWKIKCWSNTKLVSMISTSSKRLSNYNNLTRLENPGSLQDPSTTQPQSWLQLVSTSFESLYKELSFSMIFFKKHLDWIKDLRIFRPPLQYNRQK